MERTRRTAARRAAALVAATLLVAACAEDAPDTSSTSADSGTSGTSGSAVSTDGTAASGAEQPTDTPVTADEIGDADASAFGAVFLDEALVESVEVVDCTLENGSETTCYRLVASSQPDALAVTGPFCPSTVTDEHGMFTWAGENPGLYALDEEFWEMVTALGYTYVNEDGSINIADPAGARPEGDACLEAVPDDSFTLQMLIPTSPELLDTPTELGTVSQLGVAVDGATIFGDAPTGNALPALDACGGHNDPSGYYHWHFGADAVQEILEREGVDLDCGHDQSDHALVGFAYDGFPIYGPEDDEGMPTDLDDCSGHVGDTHEFGTTYHYHLTDDVPNLPTCRVGAAAQGKLTSPDNPNVQLPDTGGPGGVGTAGMPPGPPPDGAGGPPPNG